MPTNKPILRTLPIFIGDEKRGEVHVIDMQTGATAHSASGWFIDNQGRRLDFSGGSLDGVMFRRTETRGAPKKEDRNAAVALAYVYFLRRAIDDGEPKPDARALKALLAYYEERAWPGIGEGDEAELRKLLNRGAKLIDGLFVMCFSGSTPERRPCAFACEARADSFNLLTDGGFVFRSPMAWRWDYGKERATLAAPFTLNGAVNHSIDGGNE